MSLYNFIMLSAFIYMYMYIILKERERNIKIVHIVKYSI